MDETSDNYMKQLTNKYFNEYKVSMTPSKMIGQIARWKMADTTIIRMPMKEQAEYADYVSTKMCKESSEIIDAFANYSLPGIKHYLSSKLDIDSCCIGNFACICIALSPGDTKDEYNQLHKNYMVANKIV